MLTQFFMNPAWKTGSIPIPKDILEAFQDGASLAISISGGKDSLAMLKALTIFWKASRYTGTIFAIHADLGRAEWHQTPDVVRDQAKEHGVDLVVVQRAKGDLFDRFEERFEARPDAPPFPSSSCRYCTSDLKREPINKHLRKFTNIVCAIGIRADESPARRKKTLFQVRSRIQTKTRTAWTWNPILHWSDEDVWNCICEGDGLALMRLWRETYASAQANTIPGELAPVAMSVPHQIHPAYVIGNERLSCSLCILASKNDLANGARCNPEAFDYLLDLERRSGFTFKPGWSLQSLIDDGLVPLPVL